MPPVFKSGTSVRGFRAGLRPMLNYDPNRYDHDPNNPPLTPRQIMALAKKAERAEKTYTPHNHQDTPPMSTMPKATYRSHKPYTLTAETVTMRAAGVMLRLPGNMILVGRRSPDAKTCPGHLQIPGGKAEPHESARDAALRELKEETGLAIDSRLLVPLDFEHRVKNAAGEVYESHVFLVDLKEAPKNIQNLEGEKYGPWVWMSMEEVLNDIAIPGLVLAINYLADKPAPAAKKPAAKKPVKGKRIGLFNTSTGQIELDKPKAKKRVFVKRQLVKALKSQQKSVARVLKKPAKKAAPKRIKAKKGK